MSFMVRCGFDHGPRMDSPIRYRRLTQLWSMVKLLSRIQASISLAGRISGICSTIPQSFEFVIAPLYLSFPRWAYCTPISFDDKSTYWIPIYFLLASAGYIVFAFGIPFRHRLLILFRYPSSLIYNRNAPRSSILSTLMVTARRIDDDASTQSLPVST